jgi:hypothetical protein
VLSGNEVLIRRKKMKRSLAIILGFIFVVSTVFILSTCGGGGGKEPKTGGGYTETVDLGGGVKVTINSPIQVTCNTSPDPGSYNDGWSKVPEMEVTGALGAGQLMTMTYESQSGFEAEDEIAYVDGDGNWIPVDSNIRQVGNTISASVDQCNTVFGAGPVYTFEVTVNYDPSAAVDEDHPLYAGAFCVNWLDPEPYESGPITSSGASHTYSLPAEDYVLFIFLDDNNNGEPDIGEPYQYYDASEDLAGATVIALDSNQTIVVNLDDSYTYPASGSVSITYPIGQTLSSDFTATGTYSGDVTDIQVEIDGNPASGATLNAAAKTWSFDVSVSGLTEDIHTISVYAYYNSTLLDSDDSSFTYSSTPVNSNPVLSLGSVSPASGNISTTFTYSVDYYDIDGDAPATIQVFIDSGGGNTITLESGIASNGTYTYAVSGAVLAEGSHTYYFYCEDGNGGSDRLPATGASDGPTVTAIPVNNNPSLTVPGAVSTLDPTSGDTSTTFTYSVDYSDVDGDAPATIAVVVDYGSYTMTMPMTLDTGTASNGTYTRSGVTFGAGSYTYYFECTDGNGGSDRLPATGAYDGPTVTAIPVNNNPSFTNGYVDPTSGTTSDTYAYSVDYYDIDGDAPATIQVFIDGSPNTMTLASGTASNGTYSLSGVTLADSAHTYYFYCEDGNGGSDRLPATGAYSGPDVSGPVPQVTATFIFKDYITGNPLAGVEWYDAETATYSIADGTGTISITGDSPLRMKGCITDVPSGYEMEETYYVDVFITEDLTRTVPIAPDEASMPDPMGIYGTLNAKSVGTISNGDIEICTSDGREVGWAYATGDGFGGYEGGIMTTGELYFIVHDHDTGENYYTVISVSGSAPFNIDISPPGVGDITLSGTADAGSEVVAHLLLGEEFVEFGSQPGDSFSFAIPLQGSDVVRLDCYLEDADGNDWTYYDPTEYTASTSGIDYSSVFSGVSIPSSWTSGLAWDDATTTLSWNSASGATFYQIEFVDTSLNSSLYAIIEDTAAVNQMVTQPMLGSGELFLASILPVYSDGYIEGFMPAQNAEGVVVWCDDIADRLQTDNDLEFEYFDSSSALPSNSVTTIVIDEIYGRVLVGTYGGGVSYSDDLVTWDRLTTTEGLTSNLVRDIEVDTDNGGYCIGSWGGVDLVDADTGDVLLSFTDANGLLSDNVYSVAIDEFNGGVWVATRDGGASFIEYGTWDITNFIPSNSDIADDFIRSIAVDPFGGVWFGTDSGGVSYFDGIDWTTFTTTEGLASNCVFDIAFDEEGGVWFCTTGGVSYLDYTGFQTYRTQDGLVSNLVQCVTIDEEGGVWFGTGNNAASGGVNYYDDSYGFVSFTSTNGLAAGYVKSIAFDPDGGMWIGVYGGGVCFLP